MSRPRRQTPHAPGLVVGHGLSDLGLRVHHKRPLANDRLVDRLPVDELECRVFQRLNFECVFLAL